MLNEIILLTSILTSEGDVAQNSSNYNQTTQNVPSENLLVNKRTYAQDNTTIPSKDSLLIELLSKEYTLQDTNLANGMPIQTQKCKSYEQLKQGYSHPERIDIITRGIGSTILNPSYVSENEINSLLEEMLADTSNNPVTNFLIGECYNLNRDIKKAVEYYEKAIQQGLDNPFVYLYVADSKFVDISHKVMRINVALNNSNTEEKDIFLLESLRDKFLKKSQELIPLYKKAIEIDPTSKPAYYHLSEIYLLNDMYVDALKTLNKAFEIHPTEIVDYMHRLMILEQMFEQNLSENVQKAVKDRFLKDIEIAFSNFPLAIYDAYLDMMQSGIFSEKEIETFKEKYKEAFQSELIQQLIIIQDTLQK